MKCSNSRQRLDPVLAPDQFGVAKPLGPEDLDRYVTRHGIYPTFLLPMGVLWSEYVWSQMNRRHRSRSVSSSTEALDSDHARYITSRIVQHAQSLAMGTRSIPTDSPGPYFQSILPERGPTPEGVPSDMNLPVGPPQVEQSLLGPARQVHSDILPYLPSISTEYIQGGLDQDGLSTYTSLDDYNAMFKSRHGRGAVDSNVIATGGMVSTTFPLKVPTPAESVSMRATNNPMTRPISKHTPSGVQSLSDQQNQASVEEEYQSPVEEDVVPPEGVAHILGEGATIFTDMTEMMLTALDKQMAHPNTVQRSVSSTVNILQAPEPICIHSEPKQDMPVTKAPQHHISLSPTQELKNLPISPPIGKDIYPDLYLPVTENYKISDKFYGYTDSVSADNNPMILVELNGLSYKYGPTVYAVDRVNGTMYGKFKGILE